MGIFNSKPMEYEDLLEQEARKNNCRVVLKRIDEFIPENEVKKTSKKSAVPARSQKQNSKFKASKRPRKDKGKRFACEWCDLLFFSYQAAKTHERSVRKSYRGAFECLKCDFRSCNGSGVLIHEAGVHGLERIDLQGEDDPNMIYKMYKCPLCSAKAQTKKEVRAHVAEFHETPEAEKMDFDLKRV